MIYTAGGVLTGLRKEMINIIVIIDSVFNWFNLEPYLVKTVTSDSDGDGRHYLGLSIDIETPVKNKELVYNSLRAVLEGPYHVTMVDEIIHIDYVKDITDFRKYLETLEE